MNVSYNLDDEYCDIFLSAYLPELLAANSNPSLWKMQIE